MSKSLLSEVEGRSVVPGEQVHFKQLDSLCAEPLEQALVLETRAAARNLALLKLRSGVEDEASMLLYRTVGRNPYDRLTHFWVGQALLPRDDKEALEHLKLAESAWYFLTEARSKTGHERIESVELAISIADASAAAHLEAASLLMKDAPNRAMELVQQASEFETAPSEDYYLLLANAQQSLGELDEAIAILRTGILDYPENADMYCRLALLLWEREQEHWLEGVVENLEKAIRLNPRHKDALMALGDIHWATGNRTQAVFWYNRLVQVAYATPGAYKRLGRALLKMGNLVMAEQVLVHANEIWPRDALFRFYLAHTYELLGDREAACHHFGEAWKLIQGDLDSYRYRFEVPSSLVELCGR